MKRCPHCQFIYPDSDETCDFDKTALEVVDDATIDAATAPALSESVSTPSKETLPGRSRKIIPIAVVCGLFLILVVFGVSYIAIKRRPVKTPVVQNSGHAPVIPVIVAQPPQLTETPSSPSPSPELSLEPSPAIAKNSPSPTKTSTPRAAVSTGPVSTSSESAVKKSRSKPVIVLTTGGRLEADEVWRTKEGIWYRRDGMVTLLRRSRVRSIVNQ